MFVGLTGRNVVIIANNSFPCGISTIDGTKPGITLETKIASQGGEVRCVDQSKATMGDLKYSFTVENAGGYPFVAFKVGYDPERPAPSGKMCQTVALSGADSDSGGQVMDCNAEVPPIMGGKIDQGIKFILQMQGNGDYTIKTTGNKLCRAVSVDDKQIKIVCDDSEISANDPSTYFKILPLESIMKSNAFVLHSTKEMCGDGNAAEIQSERVDKAKCQFFAVMSGPGCTLYSSCNTQQPAASPKNTEI